MTLTDKIGHGYLPAYQRIAAQIGPAGRVCEIGVHQGRGLDLFRTLFPDGTLAGVDSNSFSNWPDGTHRIVSAQDDPGLPAQLGRVVAEWDLIADDASHDGPTTLATFRLLWPLIAPGRYYAVEDWMVGLGWDGHGPGMLHAAQWFLTLLDGRGDVEDITYRYGLIILRKKAEGG